MAKSWISDRFPQFEAPIRRLVDQHLELEDEPLHLALTYLSPKRDQGHIYLFELIGSDWEIMDLDHDLLEVTFSASNGFPMGEDEKLHLTLANSQELDVALERGWPLATEVVAAIRVGNYEVLQADDLGNKILSRLQEEARRPEVVRG